MFSILKQSLAAAYFQKFSQIDQHGDTDEDEIDDIDQVQVQRIPQPIPNNNGVVLIPHLGLDIDIKVDCPLAYAPYKFIKENEDVVRQKGKHGGLFTINIKFNCPGAFYPRLPPIHVYQRRVSTRLE